MSFIYCFASHLVPLHLVILWRVVETSTYSWSRFCTVNCWPTASNYQLSQFKVGPGFELKCVTTVQSWPPKIVRKALCRLLLIFALWLLKYTYILFRGYRYWWCGGYSAEVTGIKLPNWWGHRWQYFSKFRRTLLFVVIRQIIKKQDKTH